MNKYYKDCLMPLLMILGGAFLWSEASLIPPPNFEPLGSAFFPKLILCVIFVLCTLLICCNVYKGAKNTEFTEEKNVTTMQGYFRMFVTLVMLVGYILLIVYTNVSFLLLTFIFMVLFGWFLTSFKAKGLIPISLIAAGTTVVVYYLFGIFLGVFLP